MRPRPLAILLLSIALIFVVPCAAFGQNSPDYFVLKSGVFFPTSDLDEFGFDTGFNGEIAYGHYLNPSFALEIGLGYYKSEAFVIGVYPDPVGPFRGYDDMKVIPITVSGKGIYPTGNLELFAEVGVGVYSVDFEGLIITSGVGNILLDDDDYVIGGNLGVGANYNIAKNIFLGLEGKYTLTGDAGFRGAAFGYHLREESKLNGLILTVNAGVRF